MGGRASKSQSEEDQGQLVALREQLQVLQNRNKRLEDECSSMGLEICRLTEVNDKDSNIKITLGVGLAAALLFLSVNAMRNSATQKKLANKLMSESVRSTRARTQAKLKMLNLNKELANAKKFGAQKLAIDLLEVRDNLSRANLSARSIVDNGEDVAQLVSCVEGMAVIQQSAEKIFADHHIKAIPVEVGVTKFDPHVHEAVRSVSLDDVSETVKEAMGSSVEPDVIVSVERDGFMIHDRVLRPS